MMGLQERHKFVDRTLARATDIFEQSGARVNLHESSFSLAELVLGATVPNIKDGVVQLTEEELNGDSLPVIALQADEEVYVGNESFLTQTARQFERSVEELEGWEPQNVETDEWIQSMLGTFRSQAPDKFLPFSIGKNYAARTLSLSSAFDMDVVKEDTGCIRAPAGRIGKILMRPIVAIAIDQPGDFRTEVFAHELVHIIQKIEQPIRVYKSQNHANMFELRKELEAYSVGAAVRLRMDGKTWDDITAQDIASNEQIEVETIRQIVNHDMVDPFHPSKQIMRELEHANRGHIIHNPLPYDEMVARFDAHLAQLKAKQS